MFEIATLIGAAKKHEVNYYLPAKIPHKAAITKDLLGYNYLAYYLERLKGHALDNDILDLLKKVNGYKQYRYEESQYLPINLDFNTKIWDLLGYFQSYKYFENAKKEVRSVFKFKDSLKFNEYLWTIKAKYFCNNVVAVGMRLTDYLKTELFYWNLSKTDYYQRAFKQFKDCVFLVFSDDIPLAKKIIGDMKLPYNFEFEDEVLHSNVDGLAAFSLCDGYILANSTFHWWGAWLGDPGYDKIVVVPQKWYTQPNYTAQDLYLPNWIIL